MNKKVLILSGPSGSGKTTWAKEHHPDARVVSADDYFLGPDGEYNFDPRLLPKAHSLCMTRFLSDIEDGHPLIIVDNTNIAAWERTNYQFAAEMTGYEVEYVYFAVKTIAALKACIKRNAHGVPPEVVSRMALEHDTDDGCLSLCMWSVIEVTE